MPESRTLVAEFAHELRNAISATAQARIQVDPASVAARPELPSRSCSKILVVDDNLTVRTAYGEALEALGYEVMLATDAEEALKIAKQSAPEVALIDIHLPTLNGYQAARALKSQNAPKPLRLIMLSGMALDEELKQLSREAGFDDFIDKGAGAKAVDFLLEST